MKRAFIYAPENPRREGVLEFLCQFIREAGQTVRVEVGEPRRSLEQNDKFHAICHDIAKAREWGGRKRDTEAWKRLLVDAWSRTEGGRQCEFVPSLDGQSVVALGLQTRRMSVRDLCSLIEFAQWWAAENDVPLNERAA